MNILWKLWILWIRILWIAFPQYCHYYPWVLSGVVLYAVCNRRVRLTKPFCAPPQWGIDTWERVNKHCLQCFFASQAPVQMGLLNWRWSKWCIASKCRRYFISLWAVHLISYIHLRDYRKCWPAECVVISGEMFASFPGKFPISQKIFKIFGPKLPNSLSMRISSSGARFLQEI